MALLSRKVFFAGIFTISLLTILTHLGIGGNYKAHSSVSVSHGTLHQLVNR